MAACTASFECYVWELKKEEKRYAKRESQKKKMKRRVVVMRLGNIWLKLILQKGFEVKVKQNIWESYKYFFLTSTKYCPMN